LKKYTFYFLFLNKMLKKIIGIFCTILNIRLIQGLQISINSTGKSYYDNEIQSGNGFACATFPRYTINPNKTRIVPFVPNQSPYNTLLDLTAGINLAPVQNQNDPAQCNSCYAFSINSALQILTQLTSTKPMSPKTNLPPAEILSSQQIIDCYNTLPSNTNCISGDIYDAVDYVVGLDSENGLCTEDSYQYQGTQLPSCQFSNGMCPNGTTPYLNYNSSSINNIIETMNFNADLLKAYLFTYGPVIVGIDMPAAFKYYSSTSEIYTAGCGTNINSVVVITGYDFTDSNNPYWTARTSFGSDWGNQGYIKIDAAISPNGTNPDPNSKYGKCGIYKYGIMLPRPIIM
jgi:hypothetical protein